MKRSQMISGRDLAVDDPLDDFERRSITLQDATKVVYVAGSGPAVIVVTEMPGISPHVASRRSRRRSRRHRHRARGPRDRPRPAPT